MFLLVVVFVIEIHVLTLVLPSPPLIGSPVLLPGVFGDREDRKDGQSVHPARIQLVIACQRMIPVPPVTQRSEKGMRSSEIMISVSTYTSVLKPVLVRFLHRHEDFVVVGDSCHASCRSPGLITVSMMILMIHKRKRDALFH